MIHKKKSTGRPVRSMCLVWLLILCLCPACNSNSGELQSDAQESASTADTSSSAESVEEIIPDTEGPVISGVQTLSTTVGEAISYRTGITARDDRDGAVMLLVDSSGVNLSAPGEYQVIYAAEDSAGNRTEVTATVVVAEPEEPEPETPEPAASTSVPRKKNPTLEDVEALADKILAKITTDKMSQWEKARAIFNYVKYNISYVGTSDKSSWIVGAYDGFTLARGDCFSYFACSKALLTRAGIPNVDIRRAGGVTNHYWQLVNTGAGYYHFDACPHLRAYPVDSFMMDEQTAREYSAWRGYNYYTYDYANCPVPVVGLSEEERNPQGTDTSEPSPEDTPEPAPEDTPEPAPEVTPAPDQAVQDGAPETSADAPLDGTESGGQTEEPTGEA